MGEGFSLPRRRARFESVEDHAGERNGETVAGRIYANVDFTESSDVFSKVYGSQKEGTDDQRGTR